MNPLILKQFSKPEGILGRVVGKIMSIRNRERINWVTSLLDVEPNDKILEIGYGPGTSIKRIGDKLFDGKLIGIDHSKLMYETAERRNASLIKRGIVRLYVGTIDDLKPEYLFDKIFAINVSLFWKEPVLELKKIGALLKKNGKVFIALQPRYAKDNEQVKTIAVEVKSQLITAGYSVKEVNFKSCKPIDVFCITAVKN